MSLWPCLYETLLCPKFHSELKCSTVLVMQDWKHINFYDFIVCTFVGRSMREFSHRRERDNADVRRRSSTVRIDRGNTRRESIRQREPTTPARWEDGSSDGNDELSDECDAGWIQWVHQEPRPQWRGRERNSFHTSTLICLFVFFNFHYFLPVMFQPQVNKLFSDWQIQLQWQHRLLILFTGPGRKVCLCSKTSVIRLFWDFTYLFTLLRSMWLSLGTKLCGWK